MKSLIVCVLAGSCCCAAGPATAPECKVVKTPAGPRLLINGRATAPVMLFVNLADMTALEETETQLGEIRSAATHGVNIVQHSVKVPWPAEGETPDYSVSDKWVDAALSASLNALL